MDDANGHSKPRGPRKRGVLRSISLSVKNNTRASLRTFSRYEYAEELATERPQTRSDCDDVPRPCPFVGCRHNLYLDVNGESGTITFVRPDVAPWDMPADRSCSIDVAEQGALTLEEVGEILNVTRERARQLEVKGLFKLKRSRDIAAIDPDKP